MLTYLALKYVHIIGACVLLGTGAGIAFFMLMAHRTKDAGVIAGVARIVVIADILFTATAVVLQPLTELALAWQVGYAFDQGWIVLSVLLYLLIGALWVPVVWMQLRMRDLAASAVRAGTPLPPQYHTAVPLVVRVRHSGLRRGAYHRLADDRPTDAGASLSRPKTPCPAG